MAEDETVAQRPRQKLSPLLGLLTFLLFGGAGVALMIYQERVIAQVLIGNGDLLFQILLGLASGALIAYAAWAIIKQPFMQPVRKHYSSVIGPIMARRIDRIFVSFCAGVGEEIMFRGALQYWLGIPITAILFVAIHGYLDPRNWRISLYGIFMTIAMLLLGWIAQRYGLLAPMIAHTLIDIYLLEQLHKEWKSRSSSPEANPVNTYADHGGPR